MAERGPGKWIKEDDFWRGVAVQVLGTLGAALVAYLFAVLAGYIRSPQQSERIVFLAALGVAAWFWVGDRSYTKSVGTNRFWAYIRATFTAAFGFCFIIMGFLFIRALTK